MGAEGGWSPLWGRVDGFEWGCRGAAEGARGAPAAITTLKHHSRPTPGPSSPLPATRPMREQDCARRTNEEPGRPLIGGALLSICPTEIQSGATI